MKIGRGFKITALALAAIFLLPVGSIEDRSIIITTLLISRIQAVRSRFKRLQDRFGADVFCYLLLSSAWTVWAWGNARPRGGHGPFHMIDSPWVWRGYPFMYEEWAFVWNPTLKAWREFHWLGMVADVAILAIASFWIAKRFSRSPRNASSVFIASLSALFVWLNVEPWVDGFPVSLRWPLPETWSALVYGFPYKYEVPYDSELRTWVLAGNIALGCVAWSILFAISRGAERGLGRLTRR